MKDDSGQTLYLHVENKVILIVTLCCSYLSMNVTFSFKLCLRLVIALSNSIGCFQMFLVNINLSISEFVT